MDTEKVGLDTKNIKVSRKRGIDLNDVPGGGLAHSKTVRNMLFDLN